MQQETLLSQGKIIKSRLFGVTHHPNEWWLDIYWALVKTIPLNMENNTIIFQKMY